MGVDPSQAILSGFGWPSLGLQASEAFTSPLPTPLSSARMTVIVIIIIIF